VEISEIALLLGGIVALLAALALGGAGFYQLARLTGLESARMCTVKDVLELATSTPQAVQQVSVQGIVECEHPILAPIAEQDCAVYRHRVVREREEHYTVHDDQGGGFLGSSQGSTRTETREVSERLPDEGRGRPFWLRDATGRVLVDPEGAELDLQETGERFEYASGTTLSQNRTLGLRYTEYMLPVGQESYVLGAVLEREGQPVLAAHPHDRSKRFLISYRNQQELTNSATIWAALSLVLAVLLLFGGSVLLILVL
jgi:hypothetical protein